MLNLFKLNTLNYSEKKYNSNKLKTSKHFPSSVREWNNSIYVFNNKIVQLISNADILTIKIIKTYFTLFNNNIERRIRTKRLLLRFRRLSSNKIYISNGEFKHINHKVIITLYLFNRQKYNYIIAIRKQYLKNIFNTSISNSGKKKLVLKNLFFQRLKSINIKGFLALKEANKEKLLFINILKRNKEYKIYKYISNYVLKFYNKLIMKSFKKLQLYLYYRQLVFINKSKFNYIYLQWLKKHLSNIYNKNIEFNLVNLKRFYLNSDILSESITLKLTRNRRNILKYLNSIKNKVNVKKKKVFLGEPLFIDNRLNLKKNLTFHKNILENNIINDLNYKDITGFRLETKGRLTRRYTASRSVSKVRYKGNLLDINSSFRELSTVLLKGNLKSNLQYTKLKSKSRIGSFGIKGWISGN
jgi:Mitochondrial ribosomal protein (VAR1)